MQSKVEFKSMSLEEFLCLELYCKFFKGFLYTFRALGSKYTDMFPFKKNHNMTLVCNLCNFNLKNVIVSPFYQKQ